MLGDEAGLAAVLGIHYDAVHQGIITQDAGVLFLSSRVRPVRPYQATIERRAVGVVASIWPLGRTSAAQTVANIWSIHGPHVDIDFWTRCLEPAVHVQLETTRPDADLVLGGDWNAIPDQSRDSLYHTAASNPCIWVNRRLLDLADEASQSPTSSDHFAASICLRVADPVVPPTTRVWKPWTLHPGILAMLPDGLESPSEAWTRAESRPIALQDAITSLDWYDTTQIIKFPSLLADLGEARAQVNDAVAMTTTDEPSSWMAASYMQNGSGTTIPALKGPSGQKITSTDDIMARVADFFASLYGTSDTCRDLLDIAMLSAPVTDDELWKSLRAANHASSPGPSGLPYPLWDLIGDEAIPRLCCGIEKGDRMDLANYRPISVSDSAILIITRAMANKLQAASGRTLPWTQGAFMAKRRTSTLVLALQGISDDVRSGQEGMPDSILKAYDRLAFQGFTRALYSHTTLQVMVNGHLTRPVHMMEAYNLALQPFMDLLAAAEVGVNVPGLGLLTCLAFADDWAQVEQALQTYESASRARLNRDKSSFFLIKGKDARTAMERALAQTILDSGFQEAEPANGEIQHLGHPVRVAGPPSPCPVSFGKRIEALGKRISMMVKDGTDLILRVKLCNSLLTPMLWHYTSTGALPASAGQEITDALKGYIFLGARAWIDPEILCLIAPDHMFIAQSIAILCHHLLADDELGQWLRRGLTLALHHQFGTSPTKRQELAHRKTRARGIWASSSISLDPSWRLLNTDALLTLPWCNPEKESERPPAWSRKQALGCINSGWETWNDILWLAPSRAHNQTWPRSWPLRPPGPKASAMNHRRRPGRPADTKGPRMGQAFGPYWRLLLAQHHEHEPSADGLLATPRKKVPAADHFPWHLLLINGRASTRIALAPKEPTIPAWPAPSLATPEQWRSAWTELHDVPAPSSAIADTYSWMHRGARLAKVDYIPAPCPEEGSHSYVESRRIATMLGIDADLELNPQQVALAWPDRAERRPRLVLWRTMVVHYIATRRNNAIRGQQGDTPHAYTYGTTE
ncbi:hypothetical protein V8E36_005208 [Tilletia maclaganii]